WSPPFSYSPLRKLGALTFSPTAKGVIMPNPVEWSHEVCRHRPAPGPGEYSHRTVPRSSPGSSVHESRLREDAPAGVSRRGGPTELRRLACPITAWYRRPVGNSLEEERELE